ncbi:hypothetical protein CRUP_038816 [Coryphaenoides rupestris]|nr:hypothetical protein CRUP_038816 [Coryphaenoides rupestris]
MQWSHCLPLLCLGLLVGLRGFSSHPVHTGLGGDDVDMFKTLLRRLEESLPADPGMHHLPVQRVDVHMPTKPDREEEEQEQEEGELQARLLDEATIREFLSAKDLKSVRNNDFSNRRSSTCFGGRMDRVGSMSSMGCNSVSRFSKHEGQ